jgi:Ca-activated chloride channel homolog
MPSSGPKFKLPSIQEGLAILARLPKPAMFATIGGLGCLAGAIIGQVYLLIFPSAPPVHHSQEPKNIILLIDTSGSMKGGFLGEVQRAAIDFVQRQEDNPNPMAVLSFDSHARVNQHLTNDTTALVNAIERMKAEGGTELGLGLQKAMNVFPDHSGKMNPEQIHNFVLVFTDGEPRDRDDAIYAANNLRRNSGEVLVIHTANAPRDFLESLTQNPDLVFSTSAGNFGTAFQQAETVINKQVGIAVSNPEGRPFVAFLSNGGWFALLAIALAIALALAQNRSLVSAKEGRLMKAEELKLCCIVGLLAGLAAGISNFLFEKITVNPTASFIGGVLAWGILGGVIGFAMTKIIVNFKLSRAITGGVIGGLAGGLIFNGLRFIGGDPTDAGINAGEIIGRVLGAIAVGAMIGLLIAWAEQIARKAYLVIHWAPKEESTVNLGDKPVTFGTGEDTFYIKNLPKGSLAFMMEQGKIIMIRQPGDSRTELKDQNKIEIGKDNRKVTIAVHAKT